MDNKVKLGKYIIRFAIIHLLLLVGLEILLAILNVDSNAGTTIGALMGAAMAASIKFIQDNKRPPTQSEKNRLSFMSLLAAWVVSTVLTGLYLLAVSDSTEIFVIIQSINLLLIAGIMVMLSLLYLLMLSFSYGYLAKKQYKAMLEKGKI